MIEAALYSLLTTTAEISAIVGTRVYPVKLPQKPTAPAITYQRIYSARVRSTSGPSGLTRTRIQIDYWATTWEGAKALADTVREAIDGHRCTTAGTRIGSIEVEADRDFYEPDALFYRVSQDLTIWHEE